MLSSEETPGETATPTPVGDRNAPVDGVGIEPHAPITAVETPTSAAARMLELAAVTADRLVSDAEMEAKSVVTTAQARADAIVEASRDEADQVAAELARSKEEQAAELNRERVTAMTALTEEKAAIEAQIARLRQMESDHFSQMRHHLTEQLSIARRDPVRAACSRRRLTRGAARRGEGLGPRNRIDVLHMGTSQPPASMPRLATSGVASLYAISPSGQMLACQSSMGRGFGYNEKRPSAATPKVTNSEGPHERRVRASVHRWPGAVALRAPHFSNRPLTTDSSTKMVPPSKHILN